MCGVAPTEGRVWEETGGPHPGALGRRRGGLGPRCPVVRLYYPCLVSKQLPRWNPCQGPRKEALLPHSLPIRTPEAQGTTPHSSSDRSAEGPGPSTEPQSLLRPKPDFHRWKLRPRKTEEPAGVTRGGGSSGTRRRACGP